MSAPSVPAARATSSVPLWLRAAPLVFLILWATGFPVAKIGLQSAGPMTFLAIRYVLVLLVLLPLQIILRPAWPQGDALRHLIVVGLLVQGLYFGLGYGAMALGVSPSAAALIQSMQPILIGIAAPRLTGEQVPPRVWAGFGLGFAGAAVVIGSKAGHAAGTLLGLAVAFASLLCITAGTLYEKRHGSHQHPVPANIVQHGIALVAFLPLAWLSEGFRVTPAPSLAAALAYLVIGNSLVALTLLLAMVRAGEVSRVSSLFFLVPPMTAVISRVLVGEQLPPVAWLGFAIAAIGVGLVSGRFRRPVPPVVATE